MARNRTSEGSQQAQWFSVYKPTQGYWTRLLTAIGASALVLWGAHWLAMRLEGLEVTTQGQVIRVGVPVLWIVVWALVLYWIIGRNSKTIDFFINVEGEMKKVNWSSRQEVIGATKVVLMFVVIFSAMLFLVDTVFMQVFQWIGVLKF